MADFLQKQIFPKLALDGCHVPLSLLVCPHVFVCLSAPVSGVCESPCFAVFSLLQSVRALQEKVRAFAAFSVFPRLKLRSPI